MARRIFRMAAAASIFALALVVPSAGPASASTASLVPDPALLGLKDAPPADPKGKPTKPTSDPTPSPEPTPAPDPSPLAPEPSLEPPPEPSAEPSSEPAPSETPPDAEPLETPPSDITGTESPPLEGSSGSSTDQATGEPDPSASPANTPSAAAGAPGPPGEPPGEDPEHDPPLGGDAPESGPPVPATPAGSAPVARGPATQWDDAHGQASAPAVADRVEPLAAAAGPAIRESSSPVGAPATPWYMRGDPGQSPRPSAAEPTGFKDAVVASAGIAAGLAVVNRAPPAVAAAIEFGRLGGGWAGAIVFNLWLRRQMSARRMSQRQLAALSGVDHSTISRLLREDRQPSLTTATKLVHALRGVRSDAAEAATADFFDRMPEEVVFPARRVELALRADEELDDDQVRRLMTLYLSARRRSAESRAGPAPPQRIGEPASRR